VPCIYIIHKSKRRRWQVKLNSRAQSRCRKRQPELLYFLFVKLNVVRMSWLLTQQWRDNQTSNSCHNSNNIIDQKTRICSKSLTDFSYKIQPRSKKTLQDETIWPSQLWSLYFYSLQETIYEQNLHTWVPVYQTTILCTMDQKIEICLKTLTDLPSKIQPSSRKALASCKNEPWRVKPTLKPLFLYHRRNSPIYEQNLHSWPTVCNTSSPPPQNLSISPTGSTTPLANF